MINKDRLVQLPTSQVRALGLGDIKDRFRLSDQVELLKLSQSDGEPQCCVAKLSTNRERALYEFVLTTWDAPELLVSLQGPGPNRWWLLLEALQQDFPDLTDPAQIRQIYGRLGRLHRRYAQRGNRTLVHGDLHRWNMVWHQGGLRFLDWEQAHYGDPIEDLALIEPETDTDLRTEIMPTGRMAELALQSYHRSGLLDSLSWNELIRQQRLLRWIKSTRIARIYEQRASTRPKGEAREVLLDHARRAWQRADHLRSLSGR